MAKKHLHFQVVALKVVDKINRTRSGVMTLLTISVRQAARAAIATSQIVLTQTLPLCGATYHILSSRALNQLFTGVSFSNNLQLFASFSQVAI